MKQKPKQTTYFKNAKKNLASLTWKKKAKGNDSPNRSSPQLNNSLGN